MRVGIVTQGLRERDDGGIVRIANGGVGVYIDQLLRHLAALDEDLELVPIRCGTGQLPAYRLERVHPCFLPGDLPHRIALQLDQPLARIARARRLDLIHFPNQFGGAFLPRSVRRVVTLHDLTPLLYPEYHPSIRVAGFRLLLGASLRRADAIIVDAHSTADEVTARYGGLPAPITTIPLGVSESLRPGPPLPTTLDLPGRYILTVGVLEPRKNHELLARCLQKLRAEGEEIGLVVVGREGWKWRDPFDAPGLESLRPHVRILRDVDEATLAALYAHAAVFAYPSLHEGFGLPVLEAMACGTPVAASNRSSLPEVVGDAGLLADPYSVDEFCSALRRLLNEPPLRAQLVARGLAHVQRFTWERTARQTFEVYRRVVESA